MRESIFDRGEKLEEMKGGLRIYKEKRGGETRGAIIRSIRAQTGLEIRPKNPADPRDFSVYLKEKKGGGFEVSSLSLNGPKWALKLSQMSSGPSRRFGFSSKSDVGHLKIRINQRLI